MAINFHEKYASQIAQAFTHASFVKGVFTAKLDFTGAKTVKVTKLVTVPEVDYQRSGTNRYGTPQDVQDIIMEYTMTQDKGFTGIVDEGDAKDQALENKAGAWLKAQLDEQTTPTADKYAFERMAAKGTALTLDAAPTKDTVVDMFASARAHFTNKLVPSKGRAAFVSASTFNLIALSPQFVSLEKLGAPAVGRGHVGELLGFRLIEVPDDYLPEGVHAIFVHEKAGCMPYKIEKTKIHKDPPGIGGSLIEGRHYYDMFVFEEKKDAVLAAKA
ncbi:MAG: hypothetical protein IJ452_06630 [Butyricicoccus sp.]|nr:hypothetical protein [Butyricicoccus sp.]